MIAILRLFAVNKFFLRAFPAIFALKNTLFSSCPVCLSSVLSNEFSSSLTGVKLMDVDVAETSVLDQLQVFCFWKNLSFRSTKSKINLAGLGCVYLRS